MKHLISAIMHDMPLITQANADLSSLNTLAIPSAADFLAVISDPTQIHEAVEFGHSHELPIFILGGGSNIVIGQPHLRCLVLKIEIRGRTIHETPEYTEVTSGAGENWDELVAWSVQQNLHGIEALSLIPGTVGAAPVQNIGAYGQELSETLQSVEVYDTQAGAMATLSKNDCQFGYRDSIFKHDGRGRFIITNVTLRLKPAKGSQPVHYPRLKDQLEAKGIAHPTVADIRETVISIRRSRLPDPNQIPTAGSFFSNPLVSAEAAEALQGAHPEMPHWPMPNGNVKLAAAWLVEKCGYKGVMEGGVGMYDKQAISLINPGHKGSDEVLAFRNRIIDAVEQKFGVTLTMEPELVTFKAAG